MRNPEDDPPGSALAFLFALTPVAGGSMPKKSLQHTGKASRVTKTQKVVHTGGKRRGGRRGNR